MNSYIFTGIRGWKRDLLREGIEANPGPTLKDLSLALKKEWEDNYEFYPENSVFGPENSILSFAKSWKNNATIITGFGIPQLSYFIDDPDSLKHLTTIFGNSETVTLVIQRISAVIAKLLRDSGKIVILFKY